MPRCALAFAFDVINSFAGMSSIRQSPAWRPYWRCGDARTGLDSGPIARRRVQSLIARLHCLVARSILWPRLARWQASRRIHGWGRQTCRRRAVPVEKLMLVPSSEQITALSLYQSRHLHGEHFCNLAKARLLRHLSRRFAVVDSCPEARGRAGLQEEIDGP
jgi:hypothetical protein